MITLKTLPEASEQEVFDQVKNHLLSQMKKSETIGGDMCLYHGIGKLSCAAGCLIGDDEYKPEFENNGWLTLIHKKLVPKDHSKLIWRLQEIHDNYSPDRWEEKLKDFATLVNLRF